MPGVDLGQCGERRTGPSIPSCLTPLAEGGAAYFPVVGRSSGRQIRDPFDGPPRLPIARNASYKLHVSVAKGPTGSRRRHASSARAANDRILMPGREDRNDLMVRARGRTVRVQRGLRPRHHTRNMQKVDVIGARARAVPGIAQRRPARRLLITETQAFLAARFRRAARAGRVLKPSGPDVRWMAGDFLLGVSAGASPDRLGLPAEVCRLEADSASRWNGVTQLRAVHAQPGLTPGPTGRVAEGADKGHQHRGASSFQIGTLTRTPPRPFLYMTLKSR